MPLPLGKLGTNSNISITADSSSVAGGTGTLLSTVVAHHENKTGKVTALAPSSASGSVAKVASGKTVVSKFQTVKQLENEITTYTASYGKTFTKQHDVGKHIKELLARILDFSQGGNHEILDALEGDKHLGTFESHDGHIVHIVKFIRMLKGTIPETGTAVAEEQPVAQIHNMFMDETKDVF